MEKVELRAPYCYSMPPRADDVDTNRAGAAKPNRRALVYNACGRSLRRRLSNRRVEDSKKNEHNNKTRKDAQLRGPFLLRDALRIADAHVRPCRAPRAH